MEKENPVLDWIKRYLVSVGLLLLGIAIIIAIFVGLMLAFGDVIPEKVFEYLIGGAVLILIFFVFYKFYYKKKK